MTIKPVAIEKWNDSARVWMLLCLCRVQDGQLIGKQLRDVPQDVQDRVAADIAEALTTGRDEGRVSVVDNWRWSFE